MSFFRRLFESRRFTLPELITLNAREGMYKGEILNALKDVVLFLAVAKQPTGPLDLDDPTTSVLIAPTYDGRFVFLLSFVDQVTLQKNNPATFPYMVDFRSIAKMLQRPGFIGLIVSSGQEHVMFTTQELIKHGLLTPPNNNAI